MKKLSRNIGIYLIIFGLVLAMAWFYNKSPNEDAKDISFSKFTQYVSQEK